MTAIEFDCELFERRLQTLKDSQDSIQNLSSWCLERRQHHKKIVAIWLQVLKKVKVEHRLTLFYLANDVIQYSKRKNFEFVESWGTTLQRATTMVRDEKVKHRILRIFKIWDQRQIYDEEFLTDLSGLISAAPKKKVDPQPISQPEEFQAALLISTMRSCATLEQATDARLRDLRENSVDIDNIEELCSSLKDRRRVEDAEKEVESASRNVEIYVRALEAEIQERKQVLELLEQADTFYETQRGEVKIVVNAYRNFGSRVKNLKKKLDELLPMLVSPIPSPDINAPSPSPDSDIDLPEDTTTLRQSLGTDVTPINYVQDNHDFDSMSIQDNLQISACSGDFANNFTSFMGGNMDFDMMNLFSESSITTGSSQQCCFDTEVKAIGEVGNIHNLKSITNEGDVSCFLKNMLPSSSTTCLSTAIPGLGLDTTDIIPESPPQMSYPDSPIIGHKLPVIQRMLDTSSASHRESSILNHNKPHLNRTLNDNRVSSPYANQSATPVLEDAMNSISTKPLPPPPLPPSIFLDDDNCYNKLPQKFPTWACTNDLDKGPFKSQDKGTTIVTQNWLSVHETVKNNWSATGTEQWESGSDIPWRISGHGNNQSCDHREALSDTPESPPIYEKSGTYNHPVEYNDAQSQVSNPISSSDVDHRVNSVTLPISNDLEISQRIMTAADVDHRNLISLTGSPATQVSINESSSTMRTNNSMWSSNDQDYRPPSQLKEDSGDIVEIIDMEMSDEETESKQKSGKTMPESGKERNMRGMITSNHLNLSPTLRHKDMDMRYPTLLTCLSHSSCGNHTKTDIVSNKSTPILSTPLSRALHERTHHFHSDNLTNFQKPHIHSSQQKLQIYQKTVKGSHTEVHYERNNVNFQENEHCARSTVEEHNDLQLHDNDSLSQIHTTYRFSRNEHGEPGYGCLRNRSDRSSDVNIPASSFLPSSKLIRSPTELNLFEKLASKKPPLFLEPPNTPATLDDVGKPVSMPNLNLGQDLNAMKFESENTSENPTKSALSYALKYRDAHMIQRTSGDIDERLAIKMSYANRDSRNYTAPSQPHNQLDYSRNKYAEKRLVNSTPPENDVETTRICFSNNDLSIMSVCSNDMINNSNAECSNRKKIESVPPIEFQNQNDERNKDIIDKKNLKISVNDSTSPFLVTNGPVPRQMQSSRTYDFENHTGNLHFRPRGFGPPNIFPPWRCGLMSRRSKYSCSGIRIPNWNAMGPRSPHIGNSVPRSNRPREPHFRGGYRIRSRANKW